MKEGVGGGVIATSPMPARRFLDEYRATHVQQNTSEEKGTRSGNGIGTARSFKSS